MYHECKLFDSSLYQLLKVISTTLHKILVALRPIIRLESLQIGSQNGFHSI